MTVERASECANERRALFEKEGTRPLEEIEAQGQRTSGAQSNTAPIVVPPLCRCSNQMRFRNGFLVMVVQKVCYVTTASTVNHSSHTYSVLRLKTLERSRSLFVLVIIASCFYSTEKRTSTSGDGPPSLKKSPTPPLPHPTRTESSPQSPPPVTDPHTHGEKSY